ncbi:MAG: hypothetical protein H7235_04405 [Bdellovibrionaceae bacterium]|nr:hypothetical protein [Pseudobdellovibrionaceae bacterium]
MSDDIKHKMRDVGENIGHFTHDAGKKIGQITAESEDYIEATKKFAKENPVQSMIVAGAVGIVVGSLLTLIFKNKRQD